MRYDNEIMNTGKAFKVDVIYINIQDMKYKSGTALSLLKITMAASH